MGAVQIAAVGCGCPATVNSRECCFTARNNITDASIYNAPNYIKTS